jgi:hypothetical protein
LFPNRYFDFNEHAFGFNNKSNGDVEFRLLADKGGYSGFDFNFKFANNGLAKFKSRMESRGWIGENSADNINFFTNVVYKPHDGAVPQYINMLDVGFTFYAIPFGVMSPLDSPTLNTSNGVSGLDNDLCIYDVSNLKSGYTMKDVHNYVNTFFNTHYYDPISEDLIKELAEGMFSFSSNTLYPSSPQFDSVCYIGYASSSSDSLYLYGITVLAGEPIELANNFDGTWGLSYLPIRSVGFITGIDSDLPSWIDDTVAFVAPGYSYANGVMQNWGFISELSSLSASGKNAIPVSWVKMATPGIIAGSDTIVGGAGSGIDADTGLPFTVDDSVSSGELADPRNPRPDWGRKFPLSLPWDVQDMIYLFRSPPSVPKMSLKFPLPSFLGGDIPFSLDMSGWEPVSVVLRLVLSVLLSIGLVLSYAKYVGIYGGD